MKKKHAKNYCVFGVALSAIAVAPLALSQAQAQNATGAAGSTTTTGTMTASSNQPMMVTGRVNNYWTDASGFVTAVDIQTANGPAVVHFAPGMANRLMQAYPLGSTASIWVQGSMRDGTQYWDLVGLGDKMPASGFWPAMSIDGLDLISGWPMIDSGATRVTVEGRLRRVVVGPKGQVVGLVVETGRIRRGTPKLDLGIGSSSGELVGGDVVWEKTASSGAPMTGGLAWPHLTLVRVGPEYRPAPDSGGNMRGVTPLMQHADIVATGYMESSRYGAVSTLGERLIASAITVNGQSVGQRGFPTFNPREKTLLNFNLNLPFITGRSPETVQVVPLGYEIYNTTGTAMMGNPTTR